MNYPRRAGIRSALVALLGALTLPLAACDIFADADDSVTIPTASQLYGQWVNIDAGTVRALDYREFTNDFPELSGHSDVYIIWSYAEGSEPSAAQGGRFSVVGEDIVTSVLFDVDPANVGKDFANTVFGFNSLELTLESVSSPTGRRVFERVQSLP